MTRVVARAARSSRLRVARRLLGVALVALSVTASGFIAVAASRARLRSPPPTLMLQDRGGRFLGEVGEQADERLGFWPVDPVPERVVAATLAIEDRRFHEHPGVDPIAVTRAVRQNVGNVDRISGASTIAMQVARLQDPGPRTYVRKATEALTALLLTERYGRDAVLAQYLRLAPYGNNVHGVAYAARRYLDKPVDDLSWAETALLAGLPQAPGTMNLYRASGRRRATDRARRILDLLLEDGTIDASTHERAIDELARLHIPERPVRPDATLHVVLHLERELAAERTRLGDAPVVRTSIDLALQERVQAVLADAVRRWEDRGAGNAAAVIVDRRTWQVVASVGSTDWHDARFAGSIDYARAPRYPGSTLKPFVYAAALERGLLDPTTIVDDLHRSRDGIGNADARFLGPMLPRQALANSRNVPAVDLAERLGLDTTYGHFRQLGLHDDRLSAGHYGLGLAIGGMPSSLLDLMGAYTALAGDGQLHALRWYDRQPVEPPRRMYREDTARLISLWLSDPMARLPSFPRRGWSEHPFPVAVKTGTSPDFRDAWTVSYSGRYLVGVWVGHPDWRPMQQLSGYRAGAQLTHRILLDLHAGQADGLSDVGFPTPGGSAPVQVCALSGHVATEACDRVVTEWFPEGRGPAHDCAQHRRLAIDVRSGLPAALGTPSAFVETRTAVDLPARYAAWAARSGMSLLERPARDDEIRVEIVSPRPGTQLRRDPEAPAGQGTLLLEAAVDPPVAQLVWYVDGQEFAVVEPPYTIRWPLQQGEHVFEARVPFRQERSGEVRVVTQ